MTIFNKKQETSAQKVFKPTHKKKNTYIVQLTDMLVDFDAFSRCQNTIMHVATLNGKAMQPEGGWLRCAEFPNPCATKMANEFKHYEPVMGEKLASTIIEYLDKNTGEPVLSLFPQNQVHFHKTGISAIVKITQEQDNICMWLPNGAENEAMRLNHASRQDFFHQVMLRQQKMLSK